jgi:hypothetical protein
MESRVGPGAREAVFAQLADTGRAEQVAQRLTDGIVLAVLSQSARLVREQIRLQAEFGPLLLLGLDDERARTTIIASDRAIVRAVTAHRPAKARDAAGGLVRGLSEHLLAAKSRVERGGALDEPISA